MTYKSLHIFVLLAFLLVGVVSAVPDTAASMVGNNNFTLTATGASGDVFFKYGTNPAQQIVYSWNVSSVAGSASMDIVGAPITPSTTFYAVACDNTGCDSTPVEFTTTEYTPAATPTILAQAITNMTHSRFNLFYMGDNIMLPYTGVLPSDEPHTARAIVAGMLWFFIFSGLWMRNRNVNIPIVVGFIMGGFLIYANMGLMMGIPPEFRDMAEVLLYAAMGGCFLVFFKK